MTENYLEPWITVNALMKDDFRETVVTIALTQIPAASADLRRRARNILTSEVSVPGFRSMDRAPVGVARQHVIKRMALSDDVFTVVICLWAEAQQSLIDSLRVAAESAGVTLQPDWTWQKAWRGCCRLEEVLKPIVDQAEALAEGRPEVEQNHLYLASYWLSGAACESDVEDESADTLLEEPTAEMSATDPTTDNLALQEELPETIAPASEPPEAAGPVKEPADEPAAGDVDHGTPAQARVAEAAKRFLSGTPEAPTVTPVVAITPTEWDLELARLAAEVEASWQSTLSAVRAVLDAVEAGDSVQVEKQMAPFQMNLLQWKQGQVMLRDAVQQALPAALDGLQSRPDLDPDQELGDTLADMSAAETIAAGDLEQVRAVLRQFEAYDQDKGNTLAQLEAVLADIAELQTDAGEWLGETSAQALAAMDSAADHTAVTLRDARERLAQAEAERRRLKNCYTQWISLCQERIAGLAEVLEEGGIPGDTAVFEQTTLDDVLSQRFLDHIPAHLYLQPRQLQRLENRLTELVEDLARTHTAPAAEAAAQLRARWSEEGLASLLQALAGEKRDAEILLLLLAANAAYPRQSRLPLSGAAAAGLWRGVELLAGPGQSFELLNQLALDLGTEWEVTDPPGQARLCLALLGATYGGTQRLPEGLLFQVTSEWPLPDMPTWYSLWEAAALEETLPPIVGDDQYPANIVAQARTHAVQMFACEGNFYVRLHSLRSRRHHQLLNNRLLPELLGHLSQLQQKDDRLAGCAERDMEGIVADIVQYVDSLTPQLTEEALLQRYEDGVQEEGLVDRERFHKTVALRVLQECGTSILEYGQALQAYGRSQISRNAPVVRGVLLAELEQVPELVSLAQGVLARIVQAAGTDRQPWVEKRSHSLAYGKLTRELLTRSTHAMRLPRVVGYLAGAPLDWASLCPLLLNDIAEPPEPAAAAALLLEQSAPNQVLSFSHHLSLDLQKQAQALGAEEEHKFSGLQTELLKVGGSVEDLAEARKIGRWQLVNRVLSARLTAQQDARETERLRMQNEASRLRRLINDQDQALFEAKETIPTEAYRLAEQGLNLARQSITLAIPLERVEAYLQELDYRLTHQSWPLAELQDAVGQLEGLVSREAISEATSRKAEEVLELLEHGELRQLGMRINEIGPSEIGTRSDLLRSWLAVRSLPAFLSEGLNLGQRRTILSLFRYFGQMTAMKHVEEEDGSPYDFMTPVVYAHWQLKYPQTTMLEDRCILLTLPGQPPSSANLKEAEYLLREKDWLGEYGWFVFLFVPGCTPAIYKRLLARNENRGLVIVDEPTILSMVLAEVDSRQPLGRLRSLMLNARGAENVDVFKINQLVQRRTAIFVGREALINRLATSGNSYALYGGRRIGKSSVLKEVEERLRQRGVKVISYAFEGSEDFSDNASAQRLAWHLGLDQVQGLDDFKRAVQEYLDSQPDLRVVLLLDETDQYIVKNPQRHGLAEVLRNLADRYSSRFCVVMAGFMDLYHCLQGGGPYTPTSDPWRRMLNDIGPLKNLSADQAEKIVREGFLNILGWQFENRAIPQWIVEHTGGHPAFVQYFCMKLQHRVAERRDHCIRLEDAEAVFDDREPEHSFIAYVRKTLEMNLNAIGRYVIVWLAKESKQARSFTRDQAQEIASLWDVPEALLDQTLEELKVNSVIEERAPGVYEFSVPDYPLILDQMGDTRDLEALESEIAVEIQKHKEEARAQG